MDGLMDFLGPKSVTERAVIGLALAAGAFGVLVVGTSLVAGLRRALGMCSALVLVVVGWAVLWPFDTAPFQARPRATADFLAATERYEVDLGGASVPLNPLCAPQLLHHGERTAKAVVLLHGVSSCPRAFVDFAPLLHERGHNVLVARLPRHGHADRATGALSDLTATELKAFGDTVVDVGAGLGDELVVLGISAGGTVAAWTAQNRPEVDRAVLVAPFFGLAGLGLRLNRLMARALLILPDVSMWKDATLREAYEGMPHAYQRQSTRALGEIMRLGYATLRQARQRDAAAGQVAIVTNGADTAVSNRVTDALTGAWQARHVPMTEYRFDAVHGLGHELIDPMEPGADPALTYPVLLDLVDAAAMQAAGR